MKPWFIAWMFTAIFVTLKLTGHVSWPWWWVFAPVLGLGAINLLFAVSSILFLLLYRKFDRKGYDNWQMQRSIKKLGERIRRER